MYDSHCSMKRYLSLFLNYNDRFFPARLRVIIPDGLFNLLFDASSLGSCGNDEVIRADGYMVQRVSLYTPS